MKVQFVIPSLSGGGAERIVTNLANALCRENHTINIILLENKKVFYTLEDKIQVQHPDYKINRNNRMISLIQIAANILLRLPTYIEQETNKFNPDVIISFLPYADIAVFLSGIHKKGYKIVFSERNDPTRRSVFMQQLLKYIYTKANVFVCQSEKVAEFYDGIDQKSKVVIPNPVERKNIPDAVEEGEKHRIVAAGRLDTQKNFQLLIDSFSDVCEQLPSDATLTIYGEGGLRSSLEEYVKSKKLFNKVFLPGATKTLLHEIKDASLFVMSSDYEGFPNALLEAMVVGLPVVSTDFWSGTARELIKKENGRLVAVGNKQELSNAIAELMKDKALRMEMRKENRKLLDKYALETIIQEWCKIILY